MNSFVKINGIWRQFEPETNKIIGEEGYVEISGFERAEASSLSELDWNDTLVLNKKLRTGWLNPDGEFFGCVPWCHRLQAEIIHQKTEVELEEEGWVRITYNPTDAQKVLVAGFGASDDFIYPTTAQLTYLYKNYQDNKHLYYSLFAIASDRKEKVKREWDLEK